MYIQIIKFDSWVLMANLRKIYIHEIHDVNIDASQADRALNWTARINKVVDRVTQE